MKRHKVDPNNLPTEEVLAINEIGVMLIGTLYKFINSPTVSCDNPKDIIYGVTHYILKSDLLNLPEDPIINEEGEEKIWREILSTRDLNISSMAISDCIKYFIENYKIKRK